MKKFIPIIVAVIIAGVGGFFLGKNSTGNPTGSIPAFSQSGGQFRSGSNSQKVGMNGGLVNGDVIGKDDRSITVQSRDGSSKIIFFSTSTQIMKSTNGSLDDLISGEQVTVMGISNSDGSITAQSIQIRPNVARPN